MIPRPTLAFLGLGALAFGVAVARHLLAPFVCPHCHARFAVRDWCDDHAEHCGRLPVKKFQDL